MCGNFGLLSLGEAPQASGATDDFKKEVSEEDELEKALSASMHEVSKLQGGKEVKKTTAVNDRNDNDGGPTENPEDLLTVTPLSILQNQTSSTEIRGGQAGGYSTFEFKYNRAKRCLEQPIATRVRMAARKRHPLAADLAAKYLSARGGRQIDSESVLTVIGHTRFATSSINKVVELHPHEWVPFHPEVVWLFDSIQGKLIRHDSYTVGVHISHNGDFDALEAYSQPLVVEEVGYWLERVLHCPNQLKGDSPKIAGCMDFFRVQGRWAAACRLAWVRIALNSVTDVSGGQQLSATAPNSFPSPAYFEQWGGLFDRIWQSHVNNVVNASNGLSPFSVDPSHKHEKFTYTIDTKGLKQFQQAILSELKSEEFQRSATCTALEYFSRGINAWNAAKISAFVHYVVRGFLRSDTYTAMTEFLTRAEGSFGLQCHTTLEPGVVVIASKGQPMSFSFDPRKSIVLFGSEVEALSVPVFQTGQWLSERIDLDSHGEVVRLGEVRALQEGNFFERQPKTVVPAAVGKSALSPAPAGKAGITLTPNSASAASGAVLRRQVSGKPGASPLPNSPPAGAMLSPNSLLSRSTSGTVEDQQKKTSGLKLKCGVEIRSYSLVTCTECTTFDLISRSVQITMAQIPFDPKVDLVGRDLSVVPAVLACIDRIWANSHSIERMASQSLSECLVKCMKNRLMTNKDTTDLLISGVEASLWMAEQWAADLRVIFPQLNVVTLSANKLLGLGGDNPSKVFFPGADECLPRRIDKNTCVLLISQSGQTFPTLHATRRMAKFAGDKLWLLTGCFNSKMEQAMVDGYKERGVPYLRNRVFNNYSGNRPAEPSTVAVAATWHTLTRLLVHLVLVTRQMLPAGRLIPPWDYDDSAVIIQLFFRRYRNNLKRWKKAKAAKAAAAAAEAAKKTLTFEEEGESEGGEVGEVVRRSKGLEQSISQQVVKSRKNSGKTYKIKDYAFDSRIVMNLTDGCIEDMSALMLQTVVPSISQIVGYDQFGNSIYRKIEGAPPLDLATIPHAQLVKQGHKWAEHVNEPWHVLIAVGIYMVISIGLGLPLFGLLGDLVVLIIRSAGGDIGHGTLAFTPRTPHIMYEQNVGWTLAGLALQIIDALWYVYLGRHFTTAFRMIYNRPLAARPGKRTIVIVDTPCVHQLLESYVSKLYACSYSNISVEVHGASGLDHFVHRFTHRVVRGVLIAVGRPDGRLCCLAKSEAAVLLAAKQAAFIRNPDYTAEGSGPDIVTVGHNPFMPNLGLAQGIVLGGKGEGKSARRQFVDEYLYERLFLTNKPFTTSMLRALRNSIKSKAGMRREVLARSKNKIFRNLSPAVQCSTFLSMSMSTHKQKEEPLPFGAHHIDPSILIKSDKAEGSVFSDFVVTLMQNRQSKTSEAKVQKLKGQSYDPAVRLAFFSKLDSQTKQIQDLQVVVQQFYECRIASLERYLAFCVMFHAMASHNCKPWFKYPWDMAKSQSNLKIATTASPISAMNTGEKHASQEVKKLAHNLGFALRKFEVQF